MKSFMMKDVETPIGLRGLTKGEKRIRNGTLFFFFQTGTILKGVLFLFMPLWT